MPDERYDPLACVVPLHIYLIYWPWSKLEGWNLKSNLKVCAISSWEFNREEVLDMFLVVSCTLGIVLIVVLY